ncbi:MAG: sugar transferase [Tannerellaceae bacterium]|jgi:exopolysaccharide biosynthesis polyprenyl glycosylphosphotransferase|nr:sugar transferase [Tannerellaceae bacterium]
MSGGGRQTLKYLAADFLSASMAWMMFNVLRYYEVALYLGFGRLSDYMTYKVVWEVQLCVPFFWIVLYYFSGYYNRTFGKSGMDDFFGTLLSVALGTTVLFFIIVLNDIPYSFEVYYRFFFFLFGVHFALTYLFRTLVTADGRRRVRRGEWVIRTLIIGRGETADSICRHLSETGYRVQACLGEDEIDSRLNGILADERIDEIIVAADSTDHDRLPALLYSLYHCKCPLKIVATKPGPLSRARLSNIRGLPLVDVTDNNFSEAGKNIKLWTDKLVAALALIILLPLYIYIMCRVRRDSPGPVIFRQERTGYRGKPFMMYKFRTMFVGAEDSGPLLASDNDARVTPFGRFMRKYRLDELPQFWNVLRGDMSLVGPRPERKHFIDLIVRQAPWYYLLHNVRPGITSLGMVKYGYAHSVEQMLERLEYDMLYYENMSLGFDLTILAYTVRTVFTGKGV